MVLPTERFSRVEIAETHTGVVAFLGDRAYKLKKPVSLGFLDFTRLETRRHVCQRELELNRRFAPDVYLDVATVSDSRGKPCDYMVVMRRLPAERRLSTLVASGHDVDHDLRQIARLMARVHCEAATSPEIASVASRDAVRRHWEDSFEQMRPFVRSVLPEAVSARVEILARRFLDGREPLFTQRIRKGRIRDGHGDLLADDIFCLEDGPRILDCLEFDDRLRWGDVLADVAFLAMDLERLGSPDRAARFLAWYREFSAETYPDSLAEHYLAYRAHVRSKVACIRHAQGEANAGAEAKQLLELAHRHLERGRIALALVGGAPGTGKSTLATKMSNLLGWTLLRSDEIRKELAGVPLDEPRPARYLEGIYRTEHTVATYTELIARARRALELGQSVILDATFSDPAWRNAAEATADATASDVVAFRCTLDPRLAQARLAGRQPASAFSSDATPQIGSALSGAMAPWPSAIDLDTSSAPEASLQTALGAIQMLPAAA